MQKGRRFAEGAILRYTGKSKTRWFRPLRDDPQFWQGGKNCETVRVIKLRFGADFWALNWRRGGILRAAHFASAH